MHAQPSPKPGLDVAGLLHYHRTLGTLPKAGSWIGCEIAGDNFRCISPRLLVAELFPPRPRGTKANSRRYVETTGDIDGAGDTAVIN